MRMLSERVRSILSPDTASTWETIAPVVPSAAYLGGGTAIAVHLAHRVSRDLDFFFHRSSVNLDELSARLSAAGPFAVTERAPGTLNGVFSATRVQFLHADEARPQRLLESPTQVDGLSVARISDLMAMKLKVVGDRGELRDYFDLMTIEQRTGRTVDEGLALFLERCRPEYPPVQGEATSRQGLHFASLTCSAVAFALLLPFPFGEGRRVRIVAMPALIAVRAATLLHVDGLVSLHDPFRFVCPRLFRAHRHRRSAPTN